MREDGAQLGDGLMAWARNDDNAEARAAAIRVAEFVNLVCGALTKR